MEAPRIDAERLVRLADGHATFMSAASPGVTALFFPNQYYASDEEYVFALAEGLRHEYETIAAAGITLQVDCPDLAMGRHVQFTDLSLEDFRKRIGMNVAALNQLTGVYGHIKDLTDTDRDIALDPFDTKVSLIVVGGELSANGSGPLSIDSPLSVELYKVAMLAPRKASGISLNGVLGERQDEILDLLVRQQKAVLISVKTMTMATNAGAQ